MPRHKAHFQNEGLGTIVLQLKIFFTQFRYFNVSFLLDLIVFTNNSFSLKSFLRLDIISVLSYETHQLKKLNINIAVDNFEEVVNLLLSDRGRTIEFHVLHDKADLILILCTVGSILIPTIYIVL